MAQSDVGICNGALQRLGASSIMNLATDNTPEARRCRVSYDDVRRSELRKHRWNFAIKRVVLAPDTAAPAFDYIYQFTLPTDCLRVLLPPEADLDWAVEGRKILTNAGSTLNLRYIADITDTNRFDASFSEMFSIALAGAINTATTNSPAKAQELDAEYKEARAEAKKANAFERVPEVNIPDSFWTVRL